MFNGTFIKNKTFSLFGVLLTLVFLLLSANIAKAQMVPVAAMKTLTNGDFYIPNPTYVPNLHTIKIDLWCNMTATDCHAGRCGCARMQGDQRGGTSPYPGIPWPDGGVDMSDQGAVGACFGQAEGGATFNYMGDVRPDRFCDMSDVGVVGTNFGQFNGYYSSNLTNIKIKFDSLSYNVTPRLVGYLKGYVDIPAGATNFTVYNGDQTVMTLVTFYTEAIPAFTPVAAMKTTTNGYFYIPNLPDLHTIKIDLWSNDTTCQDIGAGPICGPARMQGDQTGGTSPYVIPISWPDGGIDIYDTVMEGMCNGNAEGDAAFRYMADIVPDKICDIFDLVAVGTKMGMAGGNYSSNLTDIKIKFDNLAYNVTPDVNGYVSIPSGATGFIVYNGTNTALALVTFYTEEVAPPPPPTTTYCNIAFTPTSTFSGAAGTSVDVNVSLTDAAGAPVTTGNNLPTFSADFPAGPTAPVSIDNPVGSSIATANFTPLPTQAGSYLLIATSPECPGGLLAPVTITGLINVSHTGPVFINITYPWPNVPRTLIENTTFNITVAVLDEYGNICNSSYGGTPFTGLIGIFQNLSTNPPIPPPNELLDPYVCTGKSVADNCTKCNCTHQFTASDEAVYNFSLLAYSKNFEIAGNTYEIVSINNTPWNVTLDFVLEKSIPTFDGSSHLVNISGHPLPAENSSYLVVNLDKSQITPTEGMTINVTALYENGSVNIGDNYEVRVVAQPGSKTLMNSWFLSSGQALILIPSPSDLMKAGFYTINVFETENTSINGSAPLFVVPGPLARIIIYATPDVLQYMPFTVRANLTDAWGNTITTYSGPVNFTSSDVISVPKSDELTPLDEGQAFFEASANNFGVFTYNISALEPISAVVISNISTINVIKPLGCVNFTLQPASVGAAVFNISIKNTQYSPIQEVIDANNKVADGLVGWNSITGKMEGNPIACVDEYFSTMMCFTATNVSFSKAPLLFCIKELTYTPSVDDAISDHYSYNGTGGDLLSTFKYPKVLWTWGATSLSGPLPTKLDVSYTTEICDGNDKYHITATPRKLITNYFNISTQMPAGIALVPYNITNDSVLNPHEIRGNDGLLVTDEKNETVAQTGRLAKFNYSGNFYFQEAYTNDMIYPLGMASDQRGFIYVANNLTRDVKIFDIVPGKKPPLIKYIGIIQTPGYYPSGVATDSWNSLYVVGNTNPGSRDNKMCLEVYDKNKVLLTRNNCEVNASYRTIYGIAADPAGGIIYVAMANASIFAFNASNASQQIGNMSLVIRDVLMDYGCFNNKAPGGTANCSIFKNFGDTACSTNMCEAPIYSDDSSNRVRDRARGIAIKRGTLFVIDHVQYWSRVGWWGCSLFMCGGCGGCVPNPFSWDVCNGCMAAFGFWTQITRLSAFDLETLQYLDYIDIQPPLMKGPPGAFASLLTNPIGDFNFGEQTYLTHGLDVVEDETGNFEIYVAINNATRDPNAKHSIVMFKFNNSIQNFTRVGGIPYSKTLTTNVTHPHDVLVYPDLIKSTLSRGIICEGCSEKGQLNPKIIQQGMELLSKSNESTPAPPVTGGGGSVARVTSNRTATVERAYLKTNITGDVELTLDITIDKEPNGCVAPGTSQNIISYTVAGGNPYVQEAKAYSNNLNNTVEGGNIAFYLTKPAYFVKPRYPPNTLPYLSYSFFSTRFLAKHFPLMNLVDNVMGPPADTSWLLNSTYRLNFTILNNSFFGYQFIKTNLFLHNQVYTTDNDTSPFLKTGQPIKYNNTISWEFPYEYEFRPVTLIPVRLPYTPYPGKNATWCIESDLMVHFFIKCRDTNGNNQTFGEWTSSDHELIVIGSCETIDAISVSGAMAPTNASIFPCD